MLETKMNCLSFILKISQTVARGRSLLRITGGVSRNWIKKKFIFLQPILGLVFSLSLSIIIVIIVAQLLYVLERSLTFRKQLSLADQLRILSFQNNGRITKSAPNKTPAFLEKIGDKTKNLLASAVKTAYAVEKPPYQASRIEQSYPDIINLKAGKGFTFWVKFKNAGSQIWQSEGSDKIILRTFSGKKGIFCHPWWIREDQAAQLKETTFPEEIGLFKFSLRAPEVNGTYWEKFNLFKGSELISGGEIEIPIRVYGGKGMKEVKPPSVISPPSQTETWWQGIKADLSQIQEDLNWPEPEIRAALYFVEPKQKENYLPLQIKGLNSQGYEIRDKNNYLFLKQTAGELTEIDFDFNLKRYFVNLNGQRYLSTDSYLKFLSLNKETILEIPSFKNNVFWGSPVNDNKYRGSLEIQYNPNTDRLWIINQLPMEDYLKGVAEVADSSPKEFLKAQMLAARTYAMFRKTIPKYTNTPNEGTLFDLKSTQADQVYRGYGFETRSPRTAEAVQETKGMMVFYQGNIAKTYYYAQSDGRTRDCQAVGICKDFTPYLIARNDPPSQGKEMRGHGVGLPQEGGRQASREGANFIQILKYYYPGVDIKKVY